MKDKINLIWLFIYSIVAGMGCLIGVRTGEKVWNRGEREYNDRMGSSYQGKGEDSRVGSSSGSK